MPFTHYKQHDAMDCGPTCLRMVAKHYGRGFSIQKLREASQIGKEGVSFIGCGWQVISEAAESIGLKTLFFSQKHNLLLQAFDKFIF